MASKRPSGRLRASAPAPLWLALARDNRGMALLLVITVISLLTVVILQFGQSMRFGLVASTSYQDRVVLESMAQSALDIGAAALRADVAENEYDTLLDNWAKLAETPVSTLFNQGEITLDIVDLDGRFPINRLVAVAQEGQNEQGEETDGLTPEEAKVVFSRLLAIGPFAIESDQQALEIVDSLVDWIDSDDEELPYGAETSYYESLEEPYRARNGFVEFVDELLKVRGMTPELLYGTDETSGLADYITVVNGDGRININTVPILVLQALDDRIAVEDAETFDAYRRDEASYEAQESPGWYLSVTGWPGDIVIEERLLAIKGSHFLLSAAATTAEHGMKMSAVVQRDKNGNLEFLYQKMN